MFTIGLTGGVAIGKSLVAIEFGEIGASLVDTDVIEREVAGGPAGCTWTVYYGPRDTPRIECAVLKFDDGRLTEYGVGRD